MDVHVRDLLGGERVLGPLVRSNLDLARATREGLPTESAVQLSEFIGPHGAVWDTSRKPGTRLSPQDSDLVVRTASALARAIGVLGDNKKAVHWLTTENQALGGEIPLGLLDTAAGLQEVETILDRIEYGVYS